MNPAYSVILFTTASGAGYGMLFLLGLVGLMHGRASSQAFAITALVVALALITTGLLSSTFHLGRPERAWRAFSQWRTSWLSREGLAAIATYPAALAFGAAWTGLVDWPVAPFAAITSIMCTVTVFCTAKIYSTLKTIPAWHHGLVVPLYLAFALGSGGAVLTVVALFFGRFQPFQIIITLAAMVCATAMKSIYWRSLSSRKREWTMADATGLGASVRQWELPHTTVNFIQKEMGYAVARRNSEKLRQFFKLLELLGFIAGALALLVTPWLAIPMAAFYVLAIIVERWLFFAEAEHVSMLYYGKENV